MKRIASLGMYDAPALHGANDALWASIAHRLAAGGLDNVPLRLDRSQPPDAIWGQPDLLLAQCCGYPLVTHYAGRLRYLATPLYAAPGCRGASYRSRIVVRADDRAATLTDLRGRRAVINDRQSNSGTNLFRAAIAPLAGGRPFFSAVSETGSHEASLRAVMENEADVAAIDTVTFAHLARHEPDRARRVRTIGWTDALPGLPLVTSISTPEAIVDLLRAALEAVVQSAEARPACDALLIAGIERLPSDAYERSDGSSVRPICCIIQTLLEPIRH